MGDRNDQAIADSNEDLGQATDEADTKKQEPFERASGQVERATHDLSQQERAKSRQADMTELASSEPDAEGEALPAREPESGGHRGRSAQPDDQAADDDRADDDERESSTAKPITAHNRP